LFHSAEFLTRADKLWKAGVIFVEGVSDARNGQKLVAALYDGQVIAQGTRMEVMEELKGVSKLQGKDLKEGLAKAVKKARNLDDTLIAELKATGIKFTESDLKWVFKNKKGKIIFLEKGNINAGFEDILSHKNDFLLKGIAEIEISDFIIKALKENKIVGYQGIGTGRPIYELIYRGVKQRVAITTGSNGFVVGANPTSI
jgi:hypothetical protein